MRNYVDYTMPSTSKNIPGSWKKREWCDNCNCYHSRHSSLGDFGSRGSERNAALDISKGERDALRGRRIGTEGRKHSSSSKKKRGVEQKDRSRPAASVRKRHHSAVRRAILLGARKDSAATKRCRHRSATSTEGGRPPSGEEARSPVCRYCGHRCCARRYLQKGKSYLILSNSHRILQRVFEKQKKRRNRKRRTYNRVQSGRKNKTQPCRRTKRTSRESKSLQASLCGCPTALAQVHPLPPHRPAPPHLYSEITSEMICQALRHLAMWNQHVKFESILSYLQRRCPVERDAGALARELHEKLRVAAIAGTVINSGNDLWQLPSVLTTAQARDSQTAVTRFWESRSDHSQLPRLPSKPVKKILYNGEYSTWYDDS